MRCLVVDDHQLVGQAVGGLITELSGLELQAVCTSVEEACRQIAALCPDLLILDVVMPGESWQEAAALFQCLHPEGRVILLTGMSDEVVVPAALEGIVLAVVEKARAWEDLVAVVERWQSRRGAPQPALSLDALVPRERRVFKALGLGLSNKEIATQLGLSLSTVETYRKTLSRKLGLSGAELVRAATLHRCVGAVVPSALAD